MEKGKEMKKHLLCGVIRMPVKTPSWLVIRGEGKDTCPALRRRRRDEGPYGITYLKAELKRMEEERMAQAVFHKPSKPKRESRDASEVCFIPEHQLRAVRHPEAGKEAREEVMEAFHKWFSAQVDGMRQHVEAMTSHTVQLELKVQQWGEREHRVMKGVVSLILHIRTFMKSRAILTLQPRYLFLKHMSHAVEALHSRLLHFIRKRIYGGERAYALHVAESKDGTKKDLEEMYELMECFEEIMRVAPPHTWRPLQCVIRFVELQRSVLALQHLIENTVKIIEKSEDLFDFLATSEDASWGVNVVQEISSSTKINLIPEEEEEEEETEEAKKKEPLLLDTSLLLRGITEEDFSAQNLHVIFQAKYVPESKMKGMVFPQVDSCSPPSSPPLPSCNLIPSPPPQSPAAPSPPQTPESPPRCSVMLPPSSSKSTPLISKSPTQPPLQSPPHVSMQSTSTATPHSPHISKPSLPPPSPHTQTTLHHHHIPPRHHHRLVQLHHTHRHHRSRSHHHLHHITHHRQQEVGSKNA